VTKSEEVLARRAKYDRVERVVDALDRTIGVKLLKPSQQIKVQEFAPALEGTRSVVDEDPKSDTFGKVYEVPKSSPLIMAASVVEIDGSPLSFPRNRAELDAVLDMLDEEGLAAVAEGLARFSPPKDAETAGGSEAAKNSPKTPPSDKPAGS
jgi:hypothetical protein